MSESGQWPRHREQPCGWFGGGINRLRDKKSTTNPLASSSQVEGSGTVGGIGAPKVNTEEFQK